MTSLRPQSDKATAPGRVPAAVTLAAPIGCDEAERGALGGLLCLPALEVGQFGPAGDRSSGVRQGGHASSFAFCAANSSSLRTPWSRSAASRPNWSARSGAAAT